ncbi:UDP-2,3-diacylglucosamine diphosphatase [Rhodopirellula sp. JC740]|uniref:UDP-2,3-diacylglucosamine diphosphatase n=1 Tax=Rhodopirellula halodulae TaxID=2894198 RepID=A0ABS8NI80_9BACT|nr:UDP-2,3-diacylglucosamine diphosphatase [Rhodopirellula sp. JC740]MCC9643272.1 UDP-2,3-diacylglucosamine diphosphatase [Rhodopirellula sp. JC740]
MQRPAPTPVRTLLVSDVHLGSKHSRTEEFLTFLRQFHPESLYLVGDFIDGWKINTGWHWSSACDDVIAHLIELAQRGTKIHYVAGNHDSFLRNPAFRAGCMATLPRFEVANEFVMETVAGWRFLITHGDMFDCVEANAQWLSKGSTFFYDACLSMNRWYHRTWLRREQNPHGVCSHLKDRVKRWIRFVSDFENKILHHAKVSDCDGVICGHIHTPDIVSGKSMWYCNTGDWVENCTDLVERHDGQLHLVRTYDEDLFLQLPAQRQFDGNHDEPHSSGTPNLFEDSASPEWIPASAGTSSSGYAA